MTVNWFVARLSSTNAVQEPISKQKTFDKK